MDNYKKFVTVSLSEYDKNIKEQKKIFKNATAYEIKQTDNNMENDKFMFYNNDDEKIIEADFEVISTYTSIHDLWTWGWGTPTFSKKWTRIITKILNYGFSLDPKKEYHLKTELINSRFVISDPLQIDIHLAIASALSKIPNIYSFVMPEEKNEKGKYKIIKNKNDNFKILYVFLFNIKKFE